MTDKERLDFLEQYLVSLNKVGPYMNGENFRLTCQNGNYIRSHTISIRQCIDEVIKQDNQNNKG